MKVLDKLSVNLFFFWLGLATLTLNFITLQRVFTDPDRYCLYGYGFPFIWSKVDLATSLNWIIHGPNLLINLIVNLIIFILLFKFLYKREKSKNIQRNQALNIFGALLVIIFLGTLTYFHTYTTNPLFDSSWQYQGTKFYVGFNWPGRCDPQ